MKKILFGLAVCLATGGAWAAEEADAFGASFADYAEGEALSEKGTWGGTWALPLVEKNVASNVLIGTEKVLDFSAQNDETPIVFTNGVNVGVAQARYEFRAAFDVAESVDFTPVDARDCGLMIGRKTNGELVLAGAAGGTWHALYASGITAELGALYDLCIETRQIGEGVYATFFVKTGGAWTPLADADGVTLFATARAPGETFSEVSFSGNGALAGFSGGVGETAPAAGRDWKGASGGAWTDPANWSGGVVPGAGDFARVDGRVRLTNGAERAWVDGLLAQIGADGNLVVKAGSIGADLSFTLTDFDSRPRAGKPFSVGVGSFMGVTPEVTCTWWRGTNEIVSAKKNYETTPVSETTSYTFAKSDYGHWFKVQAVEPFGASIAQEFYFSKLPVLYLTTDDGATPSASKETHAGYIVSQFGEQKKINGKTLSNANLFSGPMEIKVRGNTTRGYPKKPWKIKLDAKTAMFGYKKNKHWVLLANYNDESQMRNKLAYDFANEIGSLGMESTWVECVLNGAWQGCYQFCEHIRIASDRVDIFNWEDEADDRKESSEDFSWVDPDEDDISGGYLFESSEEYDELTKFTVTSGKFVLRTMLNSPEYLYTNPAMTNWCANYLQKYCDAFTAADGYSGEDKHWSEYADVDSMAAYFLVMEMFGNNDSAKKSRYFYKDRGEKLMFGPVWDFDWGVGNHVVVSTSATGWKTFYGAASFNVEWADDPWFCTRLWTLYHKKARAAFAAIVAEDGKIDEYKELLAEAGAANDVAWWRGNGFEGDAEALRTYLADRLAWLDTNFADVPTLVKACKTSLSTAPYEQAKTLLPIAFANAPTNCLAQGQSLRLSFTVGAAVKVDVFANGLRVAQNVDASDGTLDLVVPGEALTAEKGDPNCISLVAYNDDGTLVGRNFALVTLTDFTAADATPAMEEAGVSVPSVPHEWLAAQAAVPGLEYLNAATPEEFAAAVCATPSPAGKQTPLWQDYVAGTDPDPNATSNVEFTASISMDANGEPVVTYTPDLGAKRVYVKEGKVELSDKDWTSPAPAGAKFFRVKVQLP